MHDWSHTVAHVHGYAMQGTCSAAWLMQRISSDDGRMQHSSLSHQTCACLQGAVQSFAVVCEAFASWHTVRSKHLEGELHRVLQLFRSGLDNGSWEQALSKLSPAVRTQMERMASASA